LVAGALLAGASAFAAESARIVKVLPHYLDTQGRHTLSPSLFERDAYQAQLRKHPEQRSAVRFDVQCKGVGRADGSLELFIEIRGTKSGAANPIVIVETVKRGSWIMPTLRGELFERCGDVVAWRATLWRGDQLVSEMKSFLW
jgi:hypothetical protein